MRSLPAAEIQDNIIAHLVLPPAGAEDEVRDNTSLGRKGMQTGCADALHPMSAQDRSS